MFGPLKILYIIRDCVLMIAASVFTELTIDRVFATMFPEGYERQKKPYISFILILFIYTYVAIIETLRYLEIISMIFVPILAGMVSFLTLPFLVWIYKKNNYYLNSKTILTLNKKFQVLFFNIKAYESKIAAIPIQDMVMNLTPISRKIWQSVRYV